jgi:hypothetical protein
MAFFATSSRLQRHLQQLHGLTQQHFASPSGILVITGLVSELSRKGQKYSACFSFLFTCEGASRP